MSSQVCFFIVKYYIIQCIEMKHELRCIYTRAKAKKIKEQAAKIREKSEIVKGNFRFRSNINAPLKKEINVSKRVRLATHLDQPISSLEIFFSEI